MVATLSLMGSVRLRGCAGQNLTPRSQKARGALALLGTASELRLSRTRLQDLLWSDRGKQQGSDSLRQMLRELRGSLRHEREILATGNGWIGLDPTRLRIDLSPAYDAGGIPCEFAADLDIPDPEFESWLRDMRLRLMPDCDGPGIRGIDILPLLACPSPSDPAYVVALEPVEGSGDHARMIGQMVVNEAAARACEMIPAALTDAPPAAVVGTRIFTMCFSTWTGWSLMVMLRDIPTGNRVWTHRFGIRRDQQTTTMRQAIAQITVALLDRARRTASPQWVGFPIWDVFSHSRAQLETADRTLTNIPAYCDGGVAMALRAYLRHTLIVERLTDDPAACAEAARTLARQARILAPNNPIVLAVASLSALWQGDAPGALELAQAGCRIDPDNELACHALSQALTALGRHAEALEASDRGARGALAELGPACWLMGRADVLIGLGRLGDAENSAAAAYAFAADNRPSLRYLAALRHARGDIPGTVDALQRLRLIEPDFTLALMADPAYPVRPLRLAGLLGVVHSGLLRANGVRSRAD